MNIRPSAKHEGRSEERATLERKIFLYQLYHHGLAALGKMWLNGKSIQDAQIVACA